MPLPRIELRPVGEPESFHLLGVRINAQPFSGILSRVIDAPERGERLSIHFATAHSLVAAQDLPGLRDAYARGIVEPDGMPIVWLGRRAGIAVERVCGPDFMPALIEGGLASGRSHYFYGGAPGVPERLAERLTDRFPGLHVAGTWSPPFRPLSAEEDREIVDRINATAPDYVWVGLGAPKQDLWIASHRDRLNAPALLAVGAAFDFHTGRRRRAPALLQRTGTEWLYRLASEPHRLAGRYTRVNARFAALVARERLRMARNRRP